MTRDTSYAPWAMRGLGRLARAERDLAKAQRSLAESVRAFVGMGARFEAARMKLDLAESALTRADPASAEEHVVAAAKAFTTIGVARYVERPNDLARCLGERVTGRVPSAVG